MSVPGLLFAVALSLVSLAIVLRPLLASRGTTPPRQLALRRQRDQLRDYYERALTNIRDLDEDFATGKISRDDYESEREVWALRGIRLLRAQDQLEASAAAADAQEIDRAIEAALAAYRDGVQSEPGAS